MNSRNTAGILRLVDYLTVVAKSGQLVTYPECRRALAIADFGALVALLGGVQRIQDRLQ